MRGWPKASTRERRAGGGGGAGAGGGATAAAASAMAAARGGAAGAAAAATPASERRLSSSGGGPSRFTPAGVLEAAPVLQARWASTATSAISSVFCFSILGVEKNERRTDLSNAVRLFLFLSSPLALTFQDVAVGGHDLRGYRSAAAGCNISHCRRRVAAAAAPPSASSSFASFASFTRSRNRRHHHRRERRAHPREPPAHCRRLGVGVARGPAVVVVVRARHCLFFSRCLAERRGKASLLNGMRLNRGNDFRGRRPRPYHFSLRSPLLPSRARR